MVPLFFAACAESPPATIGGLPAQKEPFSCPQRPEGQSTELTIGKEVIDGPFACEAYPGESFVRVRGAASRHFVSRNQGQDLCRQLPEGKESTEACEKVSVDAFQSALSETLHSRGVETIGFGLGPCYVRSGDWDAARYSVFIRDWKYADRAIGAIADELRRWKMADSWGLTIRPILCTVDLSQDGSPRATRQTRSSRALAASLGKRHDGVSCGTEKCEAGEECCNSSCGICVPSGGFCFSDDCVTGALRK